MFLSRQHWRTRSPMIKTSINNVLATVNTFTTSTFRRILQPSGFFLSDDRLTHLITLV